jgi:hypothetical protein
MRRLHQFVLIVSTLLASWLGMQAVHEFGHVIGAWLTGGQVARVVLNPLTISRTDLAENPHPLAVVWAGPAFGVLVPLILWSIAERLGIRGDYVLRFFAGFCPVANGLYIGVGSFSRVGDCGEMLRHGSDPWQLWIFGLLAASSGIWLWHGQGQYFGMGKSAEQVDSMVAYATLGTFAALLGLAFAVGR